MNLDQAKNLIDFQSFESFVKLTFELSRWKILPKLQAST